MNTIIALIYVKRMNKFPAESVEHYVKTPLFVVKTVEGNSKYGILQKR
jgi:hypothetical protein